VTAAGYLTFVSFLGFDLFKGQGVTLSLLHDLATLTFISETDDGLIG